MLILFFRSLFRVSIYAHVFLLNQIECVIFDMKLKIHRHSRINSYADVHIKPIYFVLILRKVRATHTHTFTHHKYFYILIYLFDAYHFSMLSTLEPCVMELLVLMTAPLFSPFISHTFSGSSFLARTV